MTEIDCGRCGSDNVKPEDGVYTCAACGKTYTPEEVELRAKGLARLSRMRRTLLVLLVACAVCLVPGALLLPGFAESGSRAGLVFFFTAACVGLFIAALVVRILFGRERRKLYPGK